jgi:hypothetical protein
VTALQIVEQILEAHACSTENGSAAENIRVLDDYVLFAQRQGRLNSRRRQTQSHFALTTRLVGWLEQPWPRPLFGQLVPGVAKWANSQGEAATTNTPAQLIAQSR